MGPKFLTRPDFAENAANRIETREWSEPKFLKTEPDPGPKMLGSLHCYTLYTLPLTYLSSMKTRLASVLHQSVLLYRPPTVLKNYP